MTKPKIHRNQLKLSAYKRALCLKCGTHILADKHETHPLCYACRVQTKEH